MDANCLLSPFHLHVSGSVMHTRMKRPYDGEGECYSRRSWFRMMWFVNHLSWSPTRITYHTYTNQSHMMGCATTRVHERRSEHPPSTFGEEWIWLEEKAIMRNCTGRGNFDDIETKTTKEQRVCIFDCIAPWLRFKCVGFHCNSNKSIWLNCGMSQNLCFYDCSLNKIEIDRSITRSW